MSLGSPYRASLLTRDDNPSLSNQCWSDNEFATTACCTSLGGTRVTVDGSSIQACTFHDSAQWNSCIHNQTGNVETKCQSSGNQGSGSLKVVTGGGMLLVGLLIVQMIATCLLV
ncbi:hypothetical protein DFH06DRAFT_1312595 [Mycena polygramma]|nr:hypothetical protein DFH06DRAFT_1344386 [Mycena polygramma]KAJ7684141.1 hypothetical protein DFH06DRAFT_1312595 [Mycena polygramma]